MNKKYIIIIFTIFLLFGLFYKFIYIETLKGTNNNFIKEKVTNDKNKLEFNINSLTGGILESSGDISL